VEAVADEDAVFAFEGDEVAEGGEGDEVEKVLQFEAGEGGALQEGVGGLEGDAGAAEIVEIGAAALGVDPGSAVGAVAVGFVVVEDDDVDVAGAKGGNFGGGIRAAVDGDEELGGVEFEAAFDAGGAESVTFVDAVGEEAVDAAAVGVEDAMEDGEGGDAVDVVVAVEGNALVCSEGGLDARDGGGHFGEEIGVVEAAEAGLEKIGDRVFVGEALGGEEAGDEGGEVEGVHEVADGAGVAGGGEDPTSLHGGRVAGDW
jgi:hypothetical protein